MFIGENGSSCSKKYVSQCYFVHNRNIEHFVQRKYTTFTDHVALLRYEIMMGWMCSWDRETGSENCVG
jgi:hypothetical protein